jgi:hypothetical protein
LAFCGDARIAPAVDGRSDGRSLRARNAAVGCAKVWELLRVRLCGRRVGEGVLIVVSTRSGGAAEPVAKLLTLPVTPWFVTVFVLLDSVPEDVGLGIISTSSVNITREFLRPSGGPSKAALSGVRRPMSGFHQQQDIYMVPRFSPAVSTGLPGVVEVILGLAPGLMSSSAAAADNLPGIAGMGGAGWLMRLQTSELEIAPDLR